MTKLAINGGQQIRMKNFPAYKTIGKEEEEAVLKILRSGVLSKYLGVWHKDFYGGPEVQALEKQWQKYFKVKHAIAVNSCTSGLYCAVGVCGITPGDEVIVSPYTMSASATAPLVYGGIPVFADIEEDYFCLDPKSVEQKITKLTKAIIVVDIFGLPYDMKKINALAKKHHLYVIEDAAQAIGAKYKNKYAGTLGDIGVFSLNYHKHIHTGEGGIVVTNNDILAERVRLIRNHAESVVEEEGVTNLINMVGFNYRMTEINAAIGRTQLNKLNNLNKQRINNIQYLAKRLTQIPCLEPAKIRQGCIHVFYAHPIKFNQKIAGIHRDKFIAAVRAELKPVKLREAEEVMIGGGYVKPLYLLPMYQKKIAFGKLGYPWSIHKGKVNYSKGSCPVVEKMYEDILITHGLMYRGMTKKDLDDIIKAFEKVWRLRKTIKN